MIKLYKTVLKTRPQFDPGLLVMKCPEFLVNAVLGKHGAATINQQPSSSIVPFLLQWGTSVAEGVSNQQPVTSNQQQI
jgi:hypothetical protein